MGQIKRGALIVLEGVDKSGKSTQCKKLVESLEKLNIKAKLVTFPDRTTLTGKLIDNYLKNKDCTLNDHAIHLLFSANRWENVDNMKALLNDGVTLIVDRYSYSGIAFSSIKKNMSFDWCKQPENGLPKPDLIFLLMLEQEDMFLRPGFGNERYENSETQLSVANMYLQLYDKNDNWQLINAARSINEVHDELLQKCIERVGVVKTTPLGTLDFSSSKKVLIDKSNNLNISNT